MEETFDKDGNLRSRRVYVMLSRTSTGFGRMLQRCGKLRYNHSAIVLDDNCDYIYAYARPKHRGLFLAGCVRESLDRYVMKENRDVPIALFEFYVSDAEYEFIDGFVKKNLGNREYLYNTYSVITQPITHGFSVNKSFSCIEFVSYMLIQLGFLDGKACKYKPDDFLEIFADRLVFEGDIREKVSYVPDVPTYYDGLTAKEFFLSIATFARITGRTIAQPFKKKAEY